MHCKDASTGLNPPDCNSVHDRCPSQLSVEGEPGRVVDKAAEKLGGLTGLVLNHAFSTHCPIGEWTGRHIDRHLAVNAQAPMPMIQRFAAHARDGGGSILFTSGQYLGPIINEIAYAVSEETLQCRCAQAAAALARQGIRVNCVNPG